MSDPVRVPSYAELPEREGLKCSWGVWGEDDKLGTLNLLTPERVAAAAREITVGKTFSLDLPWDEPNPAGFGRPLIEHEVRTHETQFGGISSFSDDYVTLWNTQSSSQWDGFRHVERAGHGWYNGLPTTEHGVDHWAVRGIIGRFALLDVARSRAASGRAIRPDAPDPIRFEDVTDCIETEGLEILPGDILLVRTGWTGWLRSLTREARAEAITAKPFDTAGLYPSESMVEFLWDHHISAIAGDNPALELSPWGGADREEDDAAPDPVAARAARRGLHVRILPMLGIPLGELFWLDDLAADCAEDGRYSGFLTSAPVKIPSGAATPPNAYAIK